jgi:hypothetical protein
VRDTTGNVVLTAAARSAPSTPSSSASSEMAEGLVQLISDREAVPDEVVRQLQLLVSHDLARHNAGRVRLGRLRLLIEMVLVLDGPDPWVSQTDYIAERQRRAANGEDMSLYPTDSAIREAYGRWASAVSAAARFVAHGGGARVAGDHHHARFRGKYSLQDIMSALIRCHADLGDWPTEWEYQEWAVIKRRLSRENPRLPTLKLIRKCFDNFDEAIAATGATFGQEQQPQSRRLR